MKKKKVYLCKIAWDHEVGETDVTIYDRKNHPKLLNVHDECGIVEAEISFKRVVKKEKEFDYDDKRNSSTSRKLEHDIKETENLIKDLGSRIKEQKNLLKKLKTLRKK